MPERRLEVTTEGGLDVVANEKAITDTRKKMNDAGIEVSLFITPDEKQIEASARTGSQFIELHTGQFAEEFAKRWGEATDEPAREDARPTRFPELERLIVRREAGACARLEGECRTRIELREPARAASRAASGGVEHRPQRHQPRGERGVGKGRARDAGLDEGLSRDVRTGARPCPALRGISRSSNFVLDAEDFSMTFDR